MDIMTLLEHLANNTHHKIKINDMVSAQSDLIKNAFTTNNSFQLKSLLGKVNNLADRDEVVTIL